MIQCKCPPCQRACPEPNALQKTCKEKKPPERAVSKYLQVERAVSELIAINVQVFGAFPQVLEWPAFEHDVQGRTNGTPSRSPRTTSTP